jgi:hypothetical protein
MSADVILVQPVAGEVRDSAGVLLFEFDGVLDENHSHTSTLTQHPTARGGTLTDHKQRQPVKLRIQATVTNTPQSGPYRDRDAHLVLIELKDGAKQLQLLTTLGIYNGMQLTSIDVTRNAGVGQQLLASLSFEEVTIPASREVPVDPAVRARLKRRRPAKAPPKPPDPDNSQDQAATDAGNTLLNNLFSLL